MDLLDIDNLDYVSFQLNYNYNNHVKPFVDANRSQLIMMPRFKIIPDIKIMTPEQQTEAIIKEMLIKFTYMINFNKFLEKFNVKHDLSEDKIKYTRHTINKGELLVNSEYKDFLKYSEDTRTNEEIIEDDFLEFSYNNENNIRDGTMSFTSCEQFPNSTFDTLNVSLSPQFLGWAPHHASRLLCFIATEDLLCWKAPFTPGQAGKARWFLELEYSKLLLDEYYKTGDGSIYDWDIYDGSMLLSTFPDFDYNYNQDVNIFKGCDAQHKCLPEKVIWWFLEMYNKNYLKYKSRIVRKPDIGDYLKHQGIIIIDSPHNPKSYPGNEPNNTYKGIEVRIFGANNYIIYLLSIYTGVLLNDTFVDTSEKVKKFLFKEEEDISEDKIFLKLQEDYKIEKMNNMNELRTMLEKSISYYKRSDSIKRYEYLQKITEKLCKTTAEKIRGEIFERRLEDGEFSWNTVFDNKKYLKYKLKYITLKNKY